MKFSTLITAMTLTATMVSPVAMAADSSSAMTDDQKKEIQQVVHDYLVSNPEVLMEVSQALQMKQQQTMQKDAQAAIGKNADKLITENMTVAGNPNGSVTLIEFFDYQCVHCKKMAPVISELIKNDSNLRVIYKEFPIFGESSEKASRAAIAASMQGKYQAMHDALIKQESKLNDSIIDTAAKSIGLNMTKFKTDMTSQKVTDALSANRQLAEELRLMGTPAFIVVATPGGKFKSGSTPAFIPGAASSETLQELIKNASAS